MKKITRNQVCIVVLLMLIIPMIAFSQPFVDILNVKYQYFPQPANQDGTTTTTSSDLREATILLPIEQKNKDLILINADMTRMNFNSKGEQELNTNLYTTSLALGYDHQWKNSKWRTMLMAIPKINSDFKDISSEDYQVGGVFMANYKKNDHLKYHFGFYYNKEFFGDYFIPLLGIEWKINDHINLFGDLPATMNLEYKFNKKIYAGIAFQSVLSSYRLSADHGSNYVRQGDNVLGDDQLNTYVNYYLTSHFVIYAQAGRTFYRIFKLYDRENIPIENNSVFLTTHDGMVFTTGLAYRIRLD